jgi:hypothetical protein
MGRRERKKQIPRCARNDNSWDFRRAGRWVVLVGHVEWLARSRSEDRPIPAERIRYSWGVKECAAMGLGEVASGEWRVTSLRNSRGVGALVMKLA